MKVALITGAAQRIGEAITRALAADGWAVAIHYHGSSAHGEDLAADICQHGGTAEIFPADFTREEDVQGLVARVEEKMGQVTCLINNASVFENDTALSATLDSWNRHMGVNLRSPFVLSQKFAKSLGTEMTGSIINIIDQRVWNLSPHFTSYTVSKAGLWTLTQTMALALAPNIRINAIGPGPTLPSVRQSAEDFSAQYTSVPLKKQTDLVDISNAVLYILGATSMTGQMIALDGGEHLGWSQGDNKTAPVE